MVDFVFDVKKIFMEEVSFGCWVYQVYNWGNLFCQSIGFFVRFVQME